MRQKRQEWAGTVGRLPWSWKHNLIFGSEWTVKRQRRERKREKRRAFPWTDLLLLLPVLSGVPQGFQSWFCRSGFQGLLLIRAFVLAALKCTVLDQEVWLKFIRRRRGWGVLSVCGGNTVRVLAEVMRVWEIHGYSGKKAALNGLNVR